MGRQHVRVLSELPDIEVVSAIDVSEEARRRVEEHVPVSTTDDWRAALDRSVDAVINALPTAEHHAVTLELLEAGKHVLVEKPIAAATSEAEDLIRAAERHDRVLVVGHVERYNPAVEMLAGLLREGVLGDVVTIAARRVGIARPLAPNTDVLVDLAIHDIDICAHLLPGSQGRLAFASARALWGNQLEDHTDLVLRFGDAVATLQANWITPVKVRRLTVTGTMGLADVDYIDQTVRLFRGAPEVFEGPLWDFFAVARESEPEDVPVERAEPLRAELSNFVNRVRAGDSSLTASRQAAQALALAVEARSVVRGAVSKEGR